jgi:hypothetical protein
MPVHKFRTFQEAREALWTDAGDPRLLERMKRLGEMARPVGRPHGIFRYRTLAEAKADPASKRAR